MRKIALYAAAALIFLLLDRIPSQAVPAPHDSPCLQCHVSHNMLGNQTNDLVCLTCHNSSGGAKAQTMPFAPADAATPQGVGGTSHNWGGSDTNADAGAQPPLIPELALKQHEGKMSCAKCHNLHGPRESASNSAPFLRTLNDRDQMCLDCHRSRNTQSHSAGSHPVQVRYSAAALTNAAGFYLPPRSANPADPSAAVKLIKGQVSCSSCHGIHYTDSNSATADSPSSALLGLLQAKNGALLRTDLRGAAADDVNLCTTCHQGKTAHNARGQNVQCTDCHGAHVAPADGSTPNVWLLRRFMTYSTLAGRADNRALNIPTFFLSTTSKNYRDANGTGVCQSCHALPSTVLEHSQPDVNCNACHYHGNASGSFSAAGGSCTSCHGQPPAANVQGGPSGYANGYLGVDESASAHTSHVGAYSYTCNDCHKGALHASGNYQQVFRSPSGTLAALAGATPHYDTASRSCATVYCHSNGAPRGGTIRYAAPVSFANGKGSIIGRAGECVSCHGGAVGSFNNLSTNAHFRHVSTDGVSGKGYGCVTCHASTVSGNGAIADKTKHVNGAKDLSFSGVAAGTASNGAGCSTYCHSNGRGALAAVSWTDRKSGACGTCHAATTPLGGSLIATGAHFAHFSSSATSYGPMFSQGSAAGCQVCHNYNGEVAALHVNGSVDLNSGLGYSGAGTGTCTPCHQQQVSWNGGAVSCESCHTGALSVINGASAPDKSLASTRGHGAAGQSCLACHDRNQRHLNGGSRLQAGLTGGANAECKYCHDNAAKVSTPGFMNMSSHVTVKGGSQAMACATCHDPHGTTNLSQIRTVINGQTVTYTDRSTGLVDGSTNQGLCQVCHTNTAHYRAGTAETNHPAADCLNCHRHNAPGAAFKPQGGCDACHGYPPAPKRSLSAVVFGRMNNWSAARFEDYSGGGGAHLVAAHVSPNAKPSEGWANCAVCHNSGIADSTPYHKMTLPLSGHVSNVTVAVDPKYRFDNSYLIYTGAKLVDPPAKNATGSCFNMSCHMSPSPRWSIER